MEMDARTTEQPMESMYTSASGVGGGSEADGLSLPVSRADDALHDSGHRGSFSSNRSPKRESNEHCVARARENRESSSS